MDKSNDPRLAQLNSATLLANKMRKSSEDGSQPPSYIDACMHPRIINTYYCGQLKVYVQSDMATGGGKVVFLTVHDTSTNHRSLAPFFAQPSMHAVRARSTFVHVVLPGHDTDADVLPAEFEYPSLDHIAHDLNDVLDALELKTVIGFGEGAGANILCRFGLTSPNRLHGLILVDLNAAPANIPTQMLHALSKTAVSGSKWMAKAEHVLTQSGESVYRRYENSSSSSKACVPPANAARYMNAFIQRTDIRNMLASGLDCEVLLLVGQLSPHIKAVKRTARLMDMRRTTLMVVDGTPDAVSDKPNNVARALVLFCKSCGMLLGVPMFGLEDAYAKVQQKIDQAKNDAQEAREDEAARQIARQMLHNERHLHDMIDGES